MQLSDILDLAQSMGMILGAAFYVAIVIWTYKDARKRSDDPIMVATFTAIAMLPVFGVLIYMLVRPSEYLADVRERELEIRALERQLGRQERCPYCKSHIEGDYLSCPVCTTKLRQQCTGCDKPLDPRWVLCPFCETEVPGKGGRATTGPGSGGSAGARRPAAPTGVVRTNDKAKPRERSSSRERDTSARSSRSTSPAKESKETSTDAASDKDIRTEPFSAGDTTRI